jgi:hypothetical protein
MNVKGSLPLVLGGSKITLLEGNHHNIRASGQSTHMNPPIMSTCSRTFLTDASLLDLDPRIPYNSPRFIAREHVKTCTFCTHVHDLPHLSLHIRSGFMYGAHCSNHPSESEIALYYQYKQHGIHMFGVEPIFFCACVLPRVYQSSLALVQPHFSCMSPQVQTIFGAGKPCTKAYFRKTTYIGVRLPPKIAHSSTAPVLPVCHSWTQMWDGEWRSTCIYGFWLVVQTNQKYC